MNRERMLELADYLTTNVKDSEFRMDSWMKDCGTVGCIGFHTCKLFSKYFVQLSFTGESYIARYATSALGLTALEADILFLGKWSPREPYQITRLEVIDYLKCIGNGGEIKNHFKQTMFRDLLTCEVDL